MMSVQSRQDYARQVSKRYHASGRAEKSRILDEFCRTTGYNRKYAVSLLRHPPPVREAPIRRPRASQYTPAVRRELVTIWKASDCLCGKRLAPFVGPLLEALERSGEMDLSCAPAIRQRLLAISAASIDRLLSSEKRPRHKGHSLTKPGTLLRQQIPVRTFADWKESEQRPGFCEVDLVAHCGESMAGDFLYTLNLTDVYTAWTIPLPLLNRSERVVFEAIRQARALLPYPLLGLDSDNGSEFINHLLAGYCEREKITFTRCRPYHKNDQCRIEQKNWTVVRQVVGYSRLEGTDAYNKLAQLYRTLRLHINYFQPSRKLVSKERNGARVKKTYDTAKTPYQRLLDAVDTGMLPTARRKVLDELYRSLNPLQLLREVYRDQEILERMATKAKPVQKHVQDTPLPEN
jgi:hypothetical protein